MGRQRIIVVALLGAGAVSAGACRFFAKDDLAERVKRRFHEVAPRVQVTILDRDTLRIKTPDGGEATMSLDNLRATCDRNPEACETTLGNHVAGALRVNDAVRPSRARVRAVLKSDEYVRQIEQAIAAGPAEKAAENKVVTRRFLADLRIVYVLDQPESMRLLSHGVMKELGVEADELHALALANVSAGLEKVAPVGVPEAEGVFAIQAGDSYEAARLLLPALWPPLKAKIGGDLLACVPTRDVVLLTSAVPASRAKAMRRVAQRLHAEGPYSLSTAVFKWTPAGWVLFGG